MSTAPAADEVDELEAAAEAAAAAAAAGAAAGEDVDDSEVGAARWYRIVGLGGGVLLVDGVCWQLLG